MFSKVSRPSGQIDTGLGQKSPRNGCSWVHRWVQTLAADLQYALWPKNTFLWLPQFKHHPLTAEPENKPPEPSPADGGLSGSRRRDIGGRVSRLLRRFIFALQSSPGEFRIFLSEFFRYGSHLVSSDKIHVEMCPNHPNKAFPGRRYRIPQDRGVTVAFLLGDRRL